MMLPSAIKVYQADLLHTDMEFIIFKLYAFLPLSLSASL